MTGKLFYKISEDYVLRGWDRLPNAIVNQKTGEVTFLSKEKMQVLLSCDGMHDFNSLLVPEAVRDAAREGTEKGFITPCNEGEEIEEYQKYFEYPNRFVSSVHWMITGKCNYRCRHCFMSAPAGTLPSLSHGSILKIADQIAQCGIPNVSLSGGEPLVRDDIYDIITALSERRIHINQLFSNGALVNERLLEHLEEYEQNPTLVISYDGVGGWHDWLRGIDGAEEKADRAIMLWHERGFPVYAQMTVHKGNADKIRETVLHLASLGCDKARINVAYEEGEWTKHNAGYLYSKDEYRQKLLRYIPEYYEDGMPMALVLNDLVSLDPREPDQYSVLKIRNSKEDFLNESAFSCMSRTLQITPEGTIRLCQAVNETFLQLKPLVSDDPDEPVMTLSDAISGDSKIMQIFGTTYNDLKKENRQCGDCSYFDACGGGCRGNALMQTNSIMGTDSDSCKMFKEGMIDKLIAVMKQVCPSARGNLTMMP